MRASPTRSAAAPQRIGILTFHRCINYGSYWQARCLADGLRRRGLDAVLLNHDSRRVNRAEWRCAFQPLAPVRTPRSDIPLYRRKIRAFHRAIAKLPLSRPFPLESPEQAEDYDLVIVGSDEVWNLRHPWYGGHPPFFGQGLRARRLASYAASFGNHDASAGLDESRAQKLRRFAAISVRDENSQRLAGTVLEYEPPLVLDPCLQFGAPADEGEEARAPYAVIYGHSFPAWFGEAIRAWASARGLALVSIGYRNPWADEQRISAGPEAFARLMAGAQAVATNFFHGCVFALLNSRPFVCAPSDYRFNKVRDLTASIGAEERLVSAETPHMEIARLLDAPIGRGVHARIDELRARSNDYLDHVVG